MSAAETARFGAPGSTEPPLLDVLASFVRTAVEDPEALHDPPRWDGNLSYSSESTRAEDLRRYMIDQLDEIILTLNPAEETTATFATTLTMLGRHIAERRDVMASVMECAAETDAPAEASAYRAVGAILERVLEDLAFAIGALEQVPA